jgi:ABC-type nitrate/sulfonate/bicarbonate transport system permease component
MPHASPASSGQHDEQEDHARRAQFTESLRKGRARSGVMALVGLVLGALIWQFIGNHTQPSSFASFTSTISAFWQMIRDGEFFRALAVSLEVFGAGLAIALIVGFLLGLAMARIELLRTALEPYVVMLYATPAVALIPFVLAVFGFEFRAKLIIVWIFGVFPILINTLEGARSVNAELLEVARSYRSNERQLWTHVIIPYTLPYTMSGVRQAIARCLVGVIVSEFMLALSGLGGLILVSAQRFDTPSVLASVLSITLLATLLMGLGRALENYFARWRVG